MTDSVRREWTDYSYDLIFYDRREGRNGDILKHFTFRSIISRCSVGD